MHAIARLTSALAGRYRIEREIGAGGMATVYLAHDERHDREVAIKVLHPDLAAALGVERFLAEIKTTARLQHPHVLSLIDSGEADGLLYYVMPFVAANPCGSVCCGKSSSPSMTPCGWHGKWRAPWTTPTATAWCTATSSRRTSSCTKARRWSPTSASPSR